MSDLLPLGKAVEKFFPHGGLTVSTLQAAVRSGALGATKLGRSYFVTAEDIQGWVKQCRKSAKPQDCISESAKDAPQSGSSSMERARLAQAAALNISKRLKKRLPATCRKDSGPTPDNVTSLASRSPKS